MKFDLLINQWPDLSSDALEMMHTLLTAGHSKATSAQISELGRAGLAYRPDLRNRSQRLVLTDEGKKYL